MKVNIDLSACIFGEGNNREFDPKHVLVDFLAFRAGREALQKGLIAPFQFHFADASGRDLWETKVVREGNRLYEERVQSSDAFLFPITCKLTDQVGQQHEASIGTEEMMALVSKASQNGAAVLEFPVEAKPGDPGWIEIIPDECCS